jgi:mRNA interferase MazF
LNDYIHNPDYIVRRLDPFAKRKDRCDKCDGDGWDYVVTDRYSSKKEKRCKNV